jgi:DNA-directed RNA polymerase specialized sigma24 family protein
MMADEHDLQLERMRTAVAALPAVTRTVFRLHAVDALDYSAIAAQLGISIAEVERHLADAIYRVMQVPDPSEQPGQ